jgi:putative membrane protein
MIARVVVYMIGASVAVLSVGEIFQGGIIEYESVESVLIFGLILGLLNAFIKPVLRILTLPISCLTFGLFSIVISAFLFYVASRVAPGIDATIWGVLVGTAVTAVLSGIMYAIVDER